MKIDQEKPDQQRTPNIASGHILFGGYLFFDINPNYVVPKFNCCELIDQSPDLNAIGSSLGGIATAQQPPASAVAHDVIDLEIPPCVPVNQPSTATARMDSMSGPASQLNQPVISHRSDPIIDDFYEDVDFEPENHGNGKAETDIECDDEVEFLGQVSSNEAQSKILDLTNSGNTPPKAIVEQRIPVPVEAVRSRLSSTSRRSGQFKSFIDISNEEFSDANALLGGRRLYEVYAKLKDIFGFNNFREGQREVIVAALLNHDCFVLMPTGAGKSLCYQLPAVLSPGVTLVVTPLLSLMEDQVMKLKQWGIPCNRLRSSMPKAETEECYADLNENEPNLKLLYATPEMIASSSRLKGVLKSLHERQMLARFVVDEAHCISQWGHDFRPDYTALRQFFEEFHAPKVPMMALTATATPKILEDARGRPNSRLRRSWEQGLFHSARSDHLGIRDSKLFVTTFVRSNLTYAVCDKSIPKFRTVMVDLQEKYPNGSGIVYCLSRWDCETVAKNIGDDALPYHADLTDNQRLETQRKWMGDKVKIICATIAFGMGIDKANVRYVVHHTMPSSIEAYYQETGRAGRDGLPADCILFYAFADHLRILRLFDGDSMKREMRGMKMQNLTQILNYCENVSVCQRKILVEHFGEIYDATNCINGMAACDVCDKSSIDEPLYRLYDFTDETLAVLNSVATVRDVTLIYLADIYRGHIKKSSRPNAERYGHHQIEMFGRGKELPESDCQRFLRKLVIDGYLGETLKQNAQHGTLFAHIYLAQKGQDFLRSDPNSREKIFFHVAAKYSAHKHNAGVKHDTGSFLQRRKVVSEAAVLKEKYRFKYADLFERCRADLRQLFQRIAEENSFPTFTAIISNEGIEQIAAVMPRTRTELLQVDSLNANKVNCYGDQIMNVLEKYWPDLDEREHNEIRNQLQILRTQMVEGPARNIIEIDAPPPASRRTMQSRKRRQPTQMQRRAPRRTGTTSKRGK